MLNCHIQESGYWIGQGITKTIYPETFVNNSAFRPMLIILSKRSKEQRICWSIPMTPSPILAAGSSLHQSIISVVSLRSIRVNHPCNIRKFERFSDSLMYSMTSSFCKVSYPLSGSDNPSITALTPPHNTKILVLHHIPLCAINLIGVRSLPLQRLISCLDFSLNQ